MLQEELEGWILRTDMRLSFARTQISSHLPSLINSVCIPFSHLDIKFYATGHDHHRFPYTQVVSLSVPEME